jgi:hypothetical protein
MWFPREGNLGRRRASPFADDKRRRTEVHMRRHRILVAILTTTTAFALASAPSQGAEAHRTVDASDFPRIGQMARILPDLAGGSRFVERDHPIWIFKENCSAYENGPSGVVRKWAYFYGPDGSTPPGLPRVHVQEFANVTAAKRAIRKIRRNIDGCYGTHHIAATEATLIRRPADVPPLGAGRPVAWKMNDHWTEPRDGAENSYYSRRIWMREGETVIGIDLWGEEPQSRRASIRLARLALRTVD